MKTLMFCDMGLTAFLAVLSGQTMKSQMFVMLLAGIYMHLLWGVRGGLYPCTKSSETCKIQINSYNGNRFETYLRNKCSCSDPDACSADSYHRITVNLLSYMTNMTVILSFCQAVQTQRQCGHSDVALRLSGSGEIPEYLEQMNCLCNSPLLLRRKWLSNYHEWHSTYACQDFKPVCQPTSKCYVSNSDNSVTVYGCKCPDGTFCRDNLANDSYDDTTYGICLP